MNKKISYLISIILLSVMILLLIFLSVRFGSVKISLKSEDPASTYIIKQIRLPRTLNAILCGATLALSGMIFQCVFKNPMADSYILGISSGASCAVAISYLFCVSTLFTPIFAISGSLLSTILLFTLNKKSTNKLLLSGVALNFFLSAITTLLIYISGKQLETVLYWTLGSFANTDYTKVYILLVIFVALLLFCMKKSRAMDLLLFDDATALSNGIDVYKTKLYLLIVASIGTAVCVAFCGVIGFVGLMSAHIMRRIHGPSHRKLTILTALFGGFIMLFSDLISRIVVQNSELPVGIVSSVIGTPIFFILLKRNNEWN